MKHVHKYLEQVIFVLCCLPFVGSFFEQSNRAARASLNFFSDGTTARWLDPTTNSLWMLRDTGVEDLLPLIWIVLLIWSVTMSIATLAIEGGTLLAWGMAILVLGSLTGFSLFYVVPLVWTLALFGACRRTPSTSRLITLAAMSLTGALWLGPWQLIATIIVVLPLSKSRITLSEALLLSFPAFCATTFTTYPFADSYPAGASVVPMSGVSWIARPFWGSDLQFSILDRATLGEVYLYPFLIFSAFALFRLFAARNKPGLSSRGKLSTPVGILCVGVWAAMALELFTSAASSDLGPLAVIQRVVPGMWTVSPFPYLFAIFLVLIFSNVTEAVRKLTVCFAVVFVAVEVFLVPSHPTPVFADRNVWVSPSASVIRAEGQFPWNSFQRMKASHMSGKTTLLFAGTDEKITLLTDHNPATRIKLSNRDKSTFCVQFAAPISISGVVLVTGNYPSDFPRGLEVLAVDDCSQSTGALSLFKQSPWRGRLQLTKDGLPYFGSQSDVRVVFPQVTTVAALRFNQIGFDPTYDWSVSGISVLQPSLEADAERAE